MRWTISLRISAGRKVEDRIALPMSINWPLTHHIGVVKRIVLTGRPGLRHIVHGYRFVRESRDGPLAPFAVFVASPPLKINSRP